MRNRAFNSPRFNYCTPYKVHQFVYVSNIWHDLVSACVADEDSCGPSDVRHCPPLPCGRDQGHSEATEATLTFFFFLFCYLSSFFKSLSLSTLLLIIIIILLLYRIKKCIYSD